MESKIEAGAFELFGLSGVSLACGHDAAGIRMAYPHVSLGLFDDKYLPLALEKPDTCAPRAGYTRYSWRVPMALSAVRKVAGWPCKATNAPVHFDLEDCESARITTEWTFDGDVAMGRYTADKPVRTGLFVNGCFAPGEVVAASRESCRLAVGEHVLHLRLIGCIGEPRRIDHRYQAEQIALVPPGAISAGPPAGKAMAFYLVELAPGSPLHFAMRLTGRLGSDIALPLNAGECDRRLASLAESYESNRMRSSGICPGGAEAIAGLSGYARAYDPRRGRVQTTVNRTWGGVNSPGLIFGWDNFFTSYLAAWEDPELGAQSLEHVVSLYGERGIAGGPTQRNLIIPVIYRKTLAVIGDAALAARTWPTMMEFMRFWFADRGDGRPWRDGNGDGLIESGSNIDYANVTPGIIIQNAMDETGYDDLPTCSAGFTEGRLGMPAEGVDFDWPSRTLTITEVGQNSLYCASCRAMANLAEELGHAADAEWLRAEQRRVASRMRQRLLNHAEGIYRDRYWSGGFSPVKTMTLFYPLLAGICDEQTAQRLKSMLLDPRQFWGDSLAGDGLIPTVSHDDPAYCDGFDGRGNYWRGNCWPPSTYIVYLAIKEAGWDDVAAEYVRRICAQFLKYWDAYGHAYENCPPTGDADNRFPYVTGWGGREMRYVWAALLPLAGLEEIFGPEAVRPGVRFGNPYLAVQSSWRGFTCAGRKTEATAGPDRTHVRFEGDAGWEFLAEPGLAVREFCEVKHLGEAGRLVEAGHPGMGGRVVRFSAAPDRPVRVRLRMSGAAAVVVNGVPISNARAASGSGWDFDFILRPEGR